LGLKAPFLLFFVCFWSNPWRNLSTIKQNLPRIRVPSVSIAFPGLGKCLIATFNINNTDNDHNARFKGQYTVCAIVGASNRTFPPLSTWWFFGIGKKAYVR
jgi:hypothetical protein